MINRRIYHENGFHIQCDCVFVSLVHKKTAPNSEAVEIYVQMFVAKEYYC